MTTVTVAVNAPEISVVAVAEGVPLNVTVIPVDGANPVPVTVIVELGGPEAFESNIVADDADAGAIATAREEIREIPNAMAMSGSFRHPFRFSEFTV